jgi:serine/threonine protein kinase
VIFHVPKQPPPKLQNPRKWSEYFVDFLDKCLRKDPKERFSAKDLLQVSFL